MNTLNDLNHPDAGANRRMNLLAEVDFKWLMAGQGCWIDPTRLRIDKDYVQDCLMSALNSGCDPLRRCASDLQLTLLVLGLARA
jgi:hypothetical protein